MFLEAVAQVDLCKTGTFQHKKSSTEFVLWQKPQKAQNSHF
jgi:hypothetical protein